MRWLARVFALFWMTAAAHAGCSLGSLPFQLQNGSIADANQVMANFNAILSGAQANCAELGVNTSITALAGLSSPLTPVLGGSSVFIAGPVGGSANAITAPIQAPGAGFTLTNGYQVVFTPAAANTGSTTLAFAGTGALFIVKRVGTGFYGALQGGELTAGAPTTVTFDGVNGVYVLSTLNNSVTSGGTGQVAFGTGAVVANGTTPLVVQSPLSVAFGGTGTTSLPVNGVVTSNGVSLSSEAPLTVGRGGTFTANPGVGPVIANNTSAFATENPLQPNHGGTGQSSLPLSVANGGTGLGATGTSGGVLGYTAAGTLASSTALGAFQLVLGGGPGVLPSTLGTLGSTTAVLHGNAGGPPSFAAVNMGTDVTGTLGTANGGTGLTAANAPNVQAFTTPGTPTYTVTAGTKWIKVRMVAGGGGGAGTGSNGGAGGASAITSPITVGATGGGGGNNGGTNPAGGIGGTGGVGGAAVRIPGSAAAAGSSVTAASQHNYAGTAGAPSMLGSFGAGGAGGTSAGSSGAVVQLSGGGSGEYVELYLSSPAASYALTVGAAGTAGGTGASAGGTGAIFVEEYNR